jgi:hypothetical protein
MAGGARSSTRSILALAGLLAGAGGVARASECRGIEFPSHVQLEGHELTLNGLGIRKATFLKVNVYVAALYVVRPSHDARALVESNGPDELILHFVRSVGVDDLRKAWVEGFARNSPAEVAALQGRISQLNAWMSDVKSGERLTFARRPGAGIQVEVNGTTKGVIAGDDFSRAFLSIWLGATPPNPELKDGLLGQPCR